MLKKQDIYRDEESLYRANSDMVKRSLTGSFIYLLIWFAVVLPNRFYNDSRELFLLYTSIFVFFSFSRIVLILTFERLYQKSIRLWHTLFFISVLFPALTWGVLCATALIHPLFEPISLIILISTAGLTGGGVAALVPNRMLTIGLISSLLIPSTIILISCANYNVSLCLVFCIYWIGMYSITKIQHKEYWKGLYTSYLLQQHASDLQQKNTLDGLTGLKNRSFFDEYLKKELKKSIRFESKLSLLLIDIDFFKKVNDEHGHLVGDECLRQIADHLKLMIKRETDVVARYGGEEFAIILPGLDKAETIVMANKVRSKIEALTITYDDETITTTVSIGATCLTPAVGQSAELVIARADKALYQAKNRGRNQVVTYDNSSTPTP